MLPGAEPIAFTARASRDQAGAPAAARNLILMARNPTDFMAQAAATLHFLLRGEGRGMVTADRWWEPGVFA